MDEVYMEVKCQSHPPYMGSCPDYEPKTMEIRIENDNFNRILEMNTLEMNTEAERRQIAAQIMASMMQNAKWGDKYSHIATIAVNAADALIAELNKKKDE